MDDLARELAGRLPDEPRWLEVRGVLLSGRAEITGGRSVESGFVARLLHGAFSVVAVVGRPPAEAIVRSTDGVTAMTPLLSQHDNADHVSRALAHCTGSAWTGARAILHLLGAGDAASPRLATNEVAFAESASRDDPPAEHSALNIDSVSPTGQSRASDIEVRLLRPDDPLDHLPPGLRYEMTQARNITIVAAVFVNGIAASFCYPCWTTEGFWDISVDTLDAYRGRALGHDAVRFMIERMREQGREPVWGALESNTSSLRLARKLGFAPVDSIVWFSRGPWAFLTAGYQEL